MFTRLKNKLLVNFSILLSGFSFAFFSANAQTCASDNFSITYQVEKNSLIINTAVNRDGESFMSGSTQVAAVDNYQAGFVTKLTAAGSVLWSKRYLTEDYNSSYFVDFVSLDDGGFMAILNSAYIDSNTNATSSMSSVLVRADKYGSVVWTRVLSNILSISFNSLDKLVNNEFLVKGGGGIDDRSISSPSYILKIDLSGNVLFKTTFSVTAASFVFLSGATISQLNSEDVIMAYQVASYTGATISLPWANVGFLFAKLDVRTGSILWHKTYMTNPSRFSIAVDNRLDVVRYISEMPNGDLKFFTSFTDNPPFNPAPFKDGLTILTNYEGSIKNTESFNNSVTGFSFLKGNKATGEDVLLCRDFFYRTVVVKLNHSNDIVFENQYASYSQTQTPVSINSYGNRLYIFSNGYRGLKTFRFIKTKSDSNMPCEESSSNMIKQTVNNLFVQRDINVLSSINSVNVLNALKVITEAYQIVVNYDCRPVCCKDTIDFTNSQTVKLCDTLYYRLPNGDIVKDSGTYYLKYPKVSGCDSVIFYRVLFPKSVKLNLGDDTCFNKLNDSLLLIAPSGLDEYKWQNQIGNNTFLVKRPGTYRLQTKNFCGSSIDSITIFDKCEFDLYIPDAFTPNGDGLNDYFKFPKQNKFKLDLFEIYDRWSTKIFSTKNPAQGWDGTSGGVKVAIGIYIYQFGLKTFDGRQITVKGRLLLIR